jgi:antirestriction protein ArdC
VLQNETRLIFTAASHAQRAADYLHGLQGALSDTAIEPEAAAVYRRFCAVSVSDN